MVLAMLALAVIPVGAAGDPNLSGLPDTSERRDDKLAPASQFLTAYNSMSTADWLKEKGMRVEASDLYTEALNLFLKLSADYPQWQPAVVSFRINYCRESLKNVERKALTPPLAGQGGDLSRIARDDGRQTTNPPAPRRYGGQKSEISNQALPERFAQTSQQSEISNLSPLNFKLQQAALRERGRDYTGALAMYITLLEEYPQEPWALKGACRCCLRLGRMDQARALVRQALTLPLPDADLNLLAALVDCNDGRYKEAITLLRQSLKQNVTCPEAHVALGVALACVGQIKEAQEETKRALSFNPKLGDAFYNLARLSLQLKPTDYDTARVHYQLALRHGAAHDPELDTLLAE
ncbi:MAG: tetratricopeptide repeat protein [Kiritimatiellae bacterium]|nr:tetratricopeptide repeat protein [Kiritimatiellia bacterium]